MFTFEWKERCFEIFREDTTHAILPDSTSVELTRGKGGRITEVKEVRIEHAVVEQDLVENAIETDI